MSIKIMESSEMVANPYRKYEVSRGRNRRCGKGTLGRENSMSKVTEV